MADDGGVWVKVYPDPDSGGGSFDPAKVISPPVSVSGPAVQQFDVKDKQGNDKRIYFLPGNTGSTRSLALSEEGYEKFAARKEVMDAIETAEVVEDFSGDPVDLLPTKLRSELTGFVEVRNAPQPEAVYSVTLGAGVLPGVMVGAGGNGGGLYNNTTLTPGGGGAGGVIGQGAHSPVILPVQGTATYTVTVASTTVGGHNAWGYDSQSTTLAVQGQTPFTAAAGGGRGTGNATNLISPSQGGSGGGGAAANNDGFPHSEGALGIPGQGNQGGRGRVGGAANSGGGGGYGSRGDGPNGGDGLDLATALNLDANDGITGQFLSLVSVDGFIAGGGAGYGGTPGPGGGLTRGGAAKDYSGAGGGGYSGSGTGAGGKGGAGAVYIITEVTV